MSSLRIPSSADAVDPDWTTWALRAGGLPTSVKVTSIIPTPIGDAVGLTGEVTKFDLTWNAADQESTSVVLKVPSVIEENRALGMMLGVYEGEHRVHTEVFEHIGVTTPICWISAGDSATGEHALLIEDLTGHQQADQMDGADLQTSEACVDVLDELHARWCDVPELDALTWLPDGYGEALRVWRDIVAATLPAFKESHDDILAAEHRVIFRRFVEEYVTLIDLSLENRRLWGDQFVARYADRLASRDIRIEGFEPRHREAALDARDNKGERLSQEMTRRLFAYLQDYDAVSALD